MTDAVRELVLRSRERWRREHKPSERERLEGFASNLLGETQPEFLDPRQRDGKPSPFWFPGLEARPWHDARDYPWLGALLKEWRTFRDEYDALMAGGDKTRLPMEGRPEFTHRGWREFLLRRYEDAGWQGHAPGGDEGAALNRRSCPKTLRLMAAVPNFGNVSFAKLDAGGVIRPHFSSVNVRITCQLGLHVPAGPERCWIEVAGERRGWKEGEAFLFDDTFMHSVENRAQSPRVILLFDALHHGLTPLEAAEVLRLVREAETA